MKKNIFILPIDKPSRLRYINGNNYALSKEHLSWRFAHHIYVISYEEIKEGDWVVKISSLYKGGGNVQKYSFIDSQFEDITFKKIILTTDQDLIVDGVQAIDDEFLEWFVKNSSCEFVKTELLNVSEVLWEEYFKKHGVYPKYPYYEKIIIPQEEPKKETLEEAAVSYAVDVNTKMGDNKEAYQNCSRLDFIAGANWQAERKYSEEDMNEFAWYFHTHLRQFTDDKQALDKGMYLKMWLKKKQHDAV